MAEEISAVYPYYDLNGELLYEVVRYEPKRFRQRVPDGQGGWVYSLGGIKRVPYRLIELINGISAGETIFIVEGEKDVETLRSYGYTATTSAQGAGWRWPDDWVNYFVGAHQVVVIPDNDQPGRDAAKRRAELLSSVVNRVRILYLPVGDGEDVTDWFNNGGTKEEFDRHIRRLFASGTEASEIPPTPKKKRIGYGIESLDSVTKGGMRNGEATVIAGITGTGKTGLVDQIALCASLETRVLYFALEMKAGRTRDRLLAKLINVSPDECEQYVHSSDPEDQRAYKDAVRRLALRDLWLYEKKVGERFSIDDLCAEIVTCDAEIIILDQLSYVDGWDDYGGNNRPGMIRRIVDLINETGKHIIFVVQCNRLAYGKRPTMANIADTALFERAADVVILLHRPYRGTSPEIDRLIEVQVAKNRNGPECLLRLGWTGETMMYSEITDTEVLELSQKAKEFAKSINFGDAS